MLKGRDLLTLADFSDEEVREILEAARTLKLLYNMGHKVNVLSGKTLALYFELPSTRTRISFEVAIHQLGGYAIYLRQEDLQLVRGESIADTARVLSRYVKAIVARVRNHEILEEMARYAEIPVINALSNLYHPCQALADLLTIYEKKGRFRGLRVAYIGDGNNNVCHSLMLACSKVGIDIRVGCPRGYEPLKEVVKKAEEAASKHGSIVEILHDPYETAKGADVIYTDVFVSMGREEERDKRLRDFAGWTITKDIVRMAKEDYIFMHCLPAHRGEEVAPEVIDDPKHSVVWDQAENRLHLQRALLALIVP